MDVMITYVIIAWSCAAITFTLIVVISSYCVYYKKDYCTCVYDNKKNACFNFVMYNCHSNR